ncbi:MAG TPA: hypothetical protein VG253_12815, partial [Streptosporangiaceae bacterium]|nr:hypothetical protein [Streptosporangiaceae bacterium]
IFYTPQHDVWWVSRYDDVRAILQEPATFSSVQAFRTPPPPPDLAEAIGGLPWEYTIAAHDRPEHTRLRRVGPGETHWVRERLRRGSREGLVTAGRHAQQQAARAGHAGRPPESGG